MMKLIVLFFYCAAGLTTALAQTQEQDPKNLAYQGEGILWAQAKATKDTTYIFEYFRSFPKGEFIMEALALLSPFDDPPGTVDAVAPKYPTRALAQSSGARIISIVLINEQGKPTQIKHLKSHPVYKSSVETAIKESTYSPARMNGKPTSAWLFLYYSFGFN